MSYQTKYLKYKEKYLKLKKEIEIQEGGLTGLDETATGLIIAGLIIAHRSYNCPSSDSEKNKKRNTLRLQFKEIKDSPVFGVIKQKLINEFGNKITDETFIAKLVNNNQIISTSVKAFEFKDALQKWKYQNPFRAVSNLTGAFRSDKINNVNAMIRDFDCLCNQTESTFSVIGQTANYLGNVFTKSTYLGHVYQPNLLIEQLYGLLTLVNEQFNYNFTLQNLSRIKDPNNQATFNSILLYEHGRAYSKVLINFMNVYNIKVNDPSPIDYTGPISIDDLNSRSNGLSDQKGGNLYTNYGKYIFFYNSKDVQAQKENLSGYWFIPTNTKGETFTDINLSSNKLISLLGSWASSELKKSYNLSLDVITDQIKSHKVGSYFSNSYTPDSYYYYLEDINDDLRKNVSLTSSLTSFGTPSKKFSKDIKDEILRYKLKILDLVNPKLYGSNIYINCFIDLIPGLGSEVPIK